MTTMPAVPASPTVRAEKLRLLYLRRRQIDDAISALERLAELRVSRSNIISMDQIRMLAEARN